MPLGMQAVHPEGQCPLAWGRAAELGAAGCAHCTHCDRGLGGAGWTNVKYESSGEGLELKMQIHFSIHATEQINDS